MNYQIKFIPLAIAIAITGCSQQSAEELVSSAEQKIEQGQSSEGTIDLKNALQIAPDNAHARFLLGKINAEKGAAGAAEKELGHALKLGYDKNEVLPVLAKAYDLQFKSIEVIDLVDENQLKDASAQSTLLFYKAMAYLKLDKPAKAKQAINQANELSTDSLFSKLGSAYIVFIEGNLEESLTKTNNILSQQPDFAEALLLKGQLTTLMKDFASAVESFDAYHALLPNMISSKVFLANAYVKNKQYSEAEKYIDQLLKVDKNQPFINQLKGLVRYQAKDFENASLHSELAIQNGLSNTPNLIISAVSAFQQKKYEQAYKRLLPIKDNFLAGHPMQKLLVMIELKLGYSSDAASKLNSMSELTENDITLLALTSAQLIGEGKINQAKELGEITNSIAFTDPMKLAEKGVMRLSLDDLDGITDLEQSLNLDSDRAFTNEALAMAYINEGLFDKALELANTWITKKPDQVNGYILAAIAQVKLARFTEAEDNYNKVLSIDESNPAANIYFSDKALAANDNDSALTFLEKSLENYPGYIPLLTRYYLVNQANLNIKQGIAPIEKAYLKDKENFALRMLYANTLFSTGSVDKTISVLQAIDNLDNAPDDYWLLLSSSFVTKKDVKNALKVTERWVTLNPNNRSAHIRLVVLHDLDNNNLAALLALESAKRHFPNDPQFGLLASHFYIATNNVVDAEKEWSNLPVDVQFSEAGQGIYGQILLGKGKPLEALPLLKDFYNYSPSYKNSTFVAKALKLSGNTSEAIAFLREYQKTEKENVLSSLQIAELAISEGNNEMAIAEYKKILELDPANTRALNNISFLLIGQKSFEEALPYAKAAYELLPDNFLVTDTYALALLKVGDVQESILLFEKALQMSPISIDISVRYAEALIMNEQKSEAETLLDSLKTANPQLMAEIRRLKGLI